MVERQLAHGKDYLLGSELTLADFYLMPSTFGFQLRTGSQGHVPKLSSVLSLAGDDGSLADCQEASRRAAAARSIEHAREWAVSHRPKY